MDSNIHAKKQYGQNFLIGDTIPSRIAEESGIHEQCGVIEIGPGLGTLTRHLAKKAKKVVAVEIDRDLIPGLTESLSDYSNVSIIEQDILKTDIAELLAHEFPDMDVFVVANLPYYITSPILWKLVEGKFGFQKIVVMVQKEFAERLMSKPGTPSYGAMTATMSYYAETKKLFTVTSGNFRPRPKVDSMVISITPYAEPVVSTPDEQFLMHLIRSSFQMRRKTLANSLARFLSLSKDDVQKGLTECGLSVNVRGEDLSLEEFNKLACYFWSAKTGR